MASSGAHLSNLKSQIATSRNQPLSARKEMDLNVLNRPQVADDLRKDKIGSIDVSTKLQMAFRSLYLPQVVGSFVLPNLPQLAADLMRCFMTENI